eukprot:COSAG02_NODE_1322_length_13259_cov_71.269985_6_plen_53_part_00
MMPPPNFSGGAGGRTPLPEAAYEGELNHSMFSPSSFYSIQQSPVSHVFFFLF